jgi:transketolase C-terminal domain/subunit
MSNELLKLGKKYKNLVVLSAGTDVHGVCEEFVRYFPDRYFSFGSGAKNMVSAAVGFVLTGKLPLVVGDRVFAAAFEQIRDDVCIPNLNVKFLARGKEDENPGKIVELLPNLEEVNDFGEAIREYGPKFLKSV